MLFYHQGSKVCPFLLDFKVENPTLKCQVEVQRTLLMLKFIYKFLGKDASFKYLLINSYDLYKTSYIYIREKMNISNLHKTKRAVNTMLTKNITHYAEKIKMTKNKQTLHTIQSLITIKKTE